MAYEFASRLETFPNYRKFETTFAGRPFVVETGKMCGLSNGSAMIRYGETCERGVRGKALRRRPHPRQLHAP